MCVTQYCQAHSSRWRTGGRREAPLPDSTTAWPSSQSCSSSRGWSATVATVIGRALAVHDLVALLAVPLVVSGLELQVRMVEEPHLEAVHGARYRDYQRRVGRFVPGIGRRR